MAPRRDHLAGPDRYRRVLARAEAAGSAVEIWQVDATHAFDEPGLTHSKIVHDRAATRDSIDRFAAFLTELSRDDPAAGPVRRARAPRSA